MLKKSLILLPALILGGCVSLLPDSGEQPPRLRLDPDAAITRAAAPLDTGLVIADPSAEAVYNTFNLAVATGPYKFEYIEAAEWADRVPVLFRIYLERRFENARIATAVGDRTEMSLTSAYTLYTDIRAFHVDRTSGTEVARVSFGARLTGPRGRTLGSQVFIREVPTGSSSVERYAAALNEAAAQTTDEAVSWAQALMAEKEAERASVEMTDS